MDFGTFIASIRRNRQGGTSEVFFPGKSYLMSDLSVSPVRLMPLPQGCIDPAVANDPAEQAYIALLLRLSAEAGEWRGFLRPDIIVRAHNEATRLAAHKPGIVYVNAFTKDTLRYEPFFREELMRRGFEACLAHGFVAVEHIGEGDVIYPTQKLVDVFVLAGAIYPENARLIAA